MSNLHYLYPKGNNLSELYSSMDLSMLETGRRILTWSGLPNVQVAELVNQAKSPKKVAKPKQKE